MSKMCTKVEQSPTDLKCFCSGVINKITRQDTDDFSQELLETEAELKGEGILDFKLTQTQPQQYENAALWLLIVHTS